MASPPALTNSAGMLSTPAYFPIFSAITAASASSRKIGRGSTPGFVDSKILLDPHQYQSCMGLSSITNYGYRKSMAIPCITMHV